MVWKARDTVLGKGHRDLYRQFKVIFEAEGLNRIDQRLTILEAFLGSENHLTAADLAGILREKGLSFSEDFVTENLRLFSQYGFAEEKEFAGRLPRYEHRHLGKHHDHLICIRCGTILEFYNREIEALQGAVAQRMGFHDLQHRMDIYGLCSNCLQKREAAIPLTMASPGERVRLIGLIGGRGIEQRLTSMGLNRGAELEVIKSGGPGPMIVASRETRIALGRGLAKHILVSLIQNPQ